MERAAPSWSGAAADPLLLSGLPALEKSLNSYERVHVGGSEFLALLFFEALCQDIGERVDRDADRHRFRIAEFNAIDCNDRFVLHRKLRGAQGFAPRYTKLSRRIKNGVPALLRASRPAIAIGLDLALHVTISRHESMSDSNTPPPRPTLKLKVAPRAIAPKTPPTPPTPPSTSNSTPPAKQRPGAHWSDEYKERMQADMDKLVR